jgi:hypothetical protein
LPQLLSGTDCVSRAEEVHPFPFENVIVLYAQKSINGEAVLPIAGRPLRKQHAELVHQYAAEFDRWSKRYRAVLTDLCDGGQKLAAYGAGHLTCAFINLHNLADLFAFVVDDTPEKQGLFLPKSQLPIVPRHHLTTQNVSACVFGLTPQLEERIIANNPQFALAGGKFFSMFVDSKRSIRNLGGRSD